jgi:hypothetical protein
MRADNAPLRRELSNLRARIAVQRPCFIPSSIFYLLYYICQSYLCLYDKTDYAHVCVAFRTTINDYQTCEIPMQSVLQVIYRIKQAHEPKGYFCQSLWVFIQIYNASAIYRLGNPPLLPVTPRCLIGLFSYTLIKYPTFRRICFYYFLSDGKR